MNFPFSYLYPDVAENLKRVYRSIGSNCYFKFQTIISPDEVLITDNGDEGCLYDGSVVSVYCGFKEPQKVILNYQVLDNEFHMTVVDDLGQEVKYLGLQFPEDQQVLRSVDPNVVLESTFVDTTAFGAIECAEHMLREDGVVFGYNNLEDIPFDVGQVDMNINEEYFNWEVKITNSMASGRNVLQTEQLYFCAVTTSYPPGRRTRRIGRGWYAFARDAGLQPGDKIIFTLTIAPEFLLANVVRLAPGTA
ncbi:hypothetical protein A2U01_0006531 [Trifolium medium]|uniref:TF-B3 domain-containing protein n=1 Tax=Trifolium medium TaxID=97028 RepID=A0A392MDV3_9FABA|nr:hypothetical protein [Trifolium medium]